MSHEIFREGDEAMPIMYYQLKEILLESPNLKASGWTMERLLDAEEENLRKELEIIDTLEPEEAMWRIQRLFPVIEENVKSGNLQAKEIYGPLHMKFKNLPGIKMFEHLWKESVTEGGIPPPSATLTGIDTSLKPPGKKSFQMGAASLN